MSRNVQKKTLAQDVFDRRWSLDEVKTLIKISVRYLLLYWSLQWGIVRSTSTRTRVSDATAVTFSVKRFNPLKLYHMSRNIFRKWFASYFLFIHEHLIVMWSPTVNLIAITTLLLTSGLHCCYRRIFKKNTNYFTLLELAFH